MLKSSHNLVLATGVSLGSLMERTTQYPAPIWMLLILIPLCAVMAGIFLMHESRS